MAQPKAAEWSTDPSTETLWAHHHAEIRDPHQVVCQWKEASDVDPRLLLHRVRGSWWEVLDQCGITLVVTREYEHLVMAFCVHQGKRRISYLHLPHPSGVAVDSQQKRIHIASTRNPNVVFDFAPCSGTVVSQNDSDEMKGLLLPVRSRYLPGSLYLHDLSMIGGELHANAVGMNAIIRLSNPTDLEYVWWPRCIDAARGPRFEKNYIQLNSIAAGTTLLDSYFTASTDMPSNRRPGHLNFPVDRRGVVFSGRTREVVGVGLTRPHSARLFGDRIWVANSGYGELGYIEEGRFEPAFRFSGWTRGLCFSDQIAFVGTSRVIPKYARYAPGLRVEDSECGIHAIDVRTGKQLGSIIWPNGNQIFAIEAIDRRDSQGFPFTPRSQQKTKSRVHLFSRGFAEGKVHSPRLSA